MCDKLDRIQRRIRNLLDLANSEVNEHEAIAAAMKAQELLKEYDLTESDVYDDYVEDTIDEEVVEGVTRVNWDRGLAHAVGNNFRCRVTLKNKKAVTFVGYTKDVAIAMATYKYLKAVASNLWNKKYWEYKSIGIKGHKGTYMLGFVAGVKAKLDENCTALKLVISDEVNNEYDRIYPNVKKYTISGTIHDRGLYDKGYTDGKNAIDSRSLSGQRLLA